MGKKGKGKAKAKAVVETPDHSHEQGDPSTQSNQPPPIAGPSTQPVPDNMNHDAHHQLGRQPVLPDPSWVSTEEQQTQGRILDAILRLQNTIGTSDRFFYSHTASRAGEDLTNPHPLPVQQAGWYGNRGVNDAGQPWEVLPYEDTNCLLNYLDFTVADVRRHINMKNINKEEVESMLARKTFQVKQLVRANDKLISRIKDLEGQLAQQAGGLQRQQQQSADGAASEGSMDDDEDDADGDDKHVEVHVVRPDGQTTLLETSKDGQVADPMQQGHTGTGGVPAAKSASAPTANSGSRYRLLGEQIEFLAGPDV